MDRKKTYRYFYIGLMTFVIMYCISGCEDSKMEEMTDTERIVTDNATEIVSEVAPETEVINDETTVQATTDGVFHLSSENYFYLLEGEWKAVEYAGSITDSHCEEMETDEYWEKRQEYTNNVIEKNLGREFNITKENLEYFGPYSELDIVMDPDTLFNVARFIPGGNGGENITLTAPYIGLSARLADEEEIYWFIIDADGTVLIEIDYRFFRLERIEECES